MSTVNYLIAFLSIIFILGLSVLLIIKFGVPILRCSFSVVLFIVSVFIIGFIVFGVISFVFGNGLSNDLETSAKNVLDGYYVTASNEYEQQFFFKANIIKNCDRKVDVVTVGSSHMISLENNSYGNSYLNLSVAASKLSDRLAILGLLEAYNVNYNKVILEIDLPSFYTNSMDFPDELMVFKYYSDYFINLITDRAPEKPKIDFNDYYTLPKYRHPSNVKVRYNFDELIDDEFYYDPDAVFHYPVNYVLRDRGDESKEEIRNVVKSNDDAYRNYHIPNESKLLVEKTIEYLINHNKEVYLVLVPRTPYAYYNNEEDKIPMFIDITKFVIDISNKYNVPFCGSFNPDDMGVVEEDFYDGFHLYPEKINSLFNFMRKIK